MVLRGKNGKGVAELLSRHVGEGIDLHSRRKRRHNRRSEAVDQPLDHQDPEIHHRLLDTGCRGKPQDLLNRLFPETEAFSPRPQFRLLYPGVQGDPQTGKCLGYDRGSRRAADAHGIYDHKSQIQNDIHDRRDAQEPEGYHRVSQSPQKKRKIVVQKHEKDPHKDDPHIFPHHLHQRIRHLEQPEDLAAPEKYEAVHHHGHGRNKNKGHDHAVFHLSFVLSSEVKGIYGTASHTESDEDRREKRHKGIGGSHGCQGVGP